MKYLFAALAALSLTACSTASSQIGEKALGNLEYCDRTYTAIVGGLGNNGGSINIKCPARPFPAQPAAPAPAP